MESMESRRLFVGGLSYDTTDSSMAAYFGNWGPLVECQVKKFPQGNSRGFGFVTFGSLAATEHCIATAPHTIDGKKVDLRRSQDKKDGPGASVGFASSTAKAYDPEELMLRKLFIAGLDEETNEDDLREFFTTFGDIEDSKVYKYPDTGKSRGFGFVTFTRSASVDEAQRNRPHLVNGRKAETRRATPKHLVGKPESKISTKKVFIGPPEGPNKGSNGLGEEISDTDLGCYFGQFGLVSSVQQLRWDDTGKKRGYGYLEMGDEDHVDKIVLVRTHLIKGREIEAKKGLSREQMAQCESEKRTGDSGYSDYDNMPGVSATADVAVGAGYGYGGGDKQIGPRFSGEARGVKRPMESDDKMMRKLYVGNLDHSTTKDDLNQYFGQYGEIEDANVKTFPDSGKSRGFGFVTFANASGVDNVQLCRPHSVSGRTVETKRFVPHGSEEDASKVKKVWIGPPDGEKHGGGHSGLSEDLKDEDLINHFQQYGLVTKIDQLRWPDSGRKRGYGYIEFEDPDTVDKIVMMRIHTVSGVRLEVKRNVERTAASRANPPGRQMALTIGPQDNRTFKKARVEPVDPESIIMRRIFIGGLSLNTTKTELTEYFEKFGGTEDVYLPVHKDTQRPKGFAFVIYQQAASVDRVQRARPHQLAGSTLETLRATPKENLGNPEAEARSKKIFIGGPSSDVKTGHSGLTDDITDDDLEEYFGQFGTVTRVDQKTWPDSGKKKGFGYLEFDDEDAVDKIVLLGIHIVKGVKLEARKGLTREQLAKVETAKSSHMGSGGQMNSHQMSLPPPNQFQQGPGGYGGGDYGGYGGGSRGDNSMKQMMGSMQNMMSGMTSGGGGGEYNNMQQMQSMMTGMQNNLSTSPMSQNMEMMQQMMKMQQMMTTMSGSGATSNKETKDQMVQSMQTMMMSMMSMMYTNMSNQVGQQTPATPATPTAGTTGASNYNYNWGQYPNSSSGGGQYPNSSSGGGKYPASSGGSHYAASSGGQTGGSSGGYGGYQPPLPPGPAPGKGGRGGGVSGSTNGSNISYPSYGSYARK